MGVQGESECIGRNGWMLAVDWREGRPASFFYLSM